MKNVIKKAPPAWIPTQAQRSYKSALREAVKEVAGGEYPSFWLKTAEKRYGAVRLESLLLAQSVEVS